MSFRDCINGHVRAGKLSKEQAQETLDLLDQYETHYRTQGGPEWASAKAASATVERKTADLARKKRLTNLKILKTQAINADMGAHSHGMSAGGMGVLTRDVWNESKGLNVEYHQKAVRGQLHGMLDKAIERLRPKALGLIKQTESLRSVVRALYGEKVADAEATAMAKAFGETMEYGRQRKNAAGQEVGSREDYHLPNPARDWKHIKAIGYEAWRDAELPRLNRDKMTDFATGLPLDDAKLETLMRDMYTAGITGGWSRREPGAIGGKALANRDAEHRFMLYKTADDWLASNDQFGKRDIFETLMGHVDAMAHDIGLLEVMGPNPTAMLRYMQDLVRQDAAVKGKTVPSERLNIMGYTYDVLAGRLSAEDLSPVMTAFSDLRQYLTAAQLGGAVIAAVPGDLYTMHRTARLAGIPQARMMARYMKLMNPANAADRVLATRLNLVAENANAVALAQRRYTGEFLGGRFAHKVSDVVLRAGLLSPHTQAGKWAFGMEFLGYLADQGGKTLPQLSPDLAGTLQRYGIDHGTWDRIRSAERHPDGFIFPEKMPDQETHSRLMRMILEETALAVPEADARVRAITTHGTKANSVLGQALRSVSMYKAFPITIITGHLMRGLAQRGGFKKGAYLAELAVMLTLGGAWSMQLSNIAKGKDPQDPTNPDKALAFWGAAALKGGALGPFGDLLFSETNRWGGGLAETITGPVVSLGASVVKTTIGNITEAAQGKRTNLPKELLDFVHYNLPGNNLFYARLAFNRVLFDQIELMIDPKAPQRLRDVQRKTKKDYGNEFWWGPGSMTPKRAPDLAAAIGQ